MLAAVLVLAALGSLLIDARRADPTVVTFARPVAAGVVLSDADISSTRVPPQLVPEGAITSAADVSGQILAAGAAAGEVVTSTRLLGPDLVSALVAEEPPGEPFTMVPLPLAEPDIIPMLRHGARVDVIGQGPSVIASGGRIVTVGDAGTVLVLLRQTQAAAVAAASLSEPLMVVLSGANAHSAP